MKRIDFIKMGFKNLWRRKLRTILTIMGVVVGTFSIVIMVSLGIGMTEGYKEQLAQWGSLTKITINRYNYMYDEESGRGSSSESKLDDLLVEKLKKMEHVKGATPVMNVSMSLKSGKYVGYVSLIGIDPECINFFDFPKMESGEMISNKNPAGIVLGKNAVYFYDPKANGGWQDEPQVDIMNAQIKYSLDDPWGEKTPKYEKLKVAGVFEETNDEASYSAYAPIEYVKELYTNKQKAEGKKVSAKDMSYESIWVSVDDVDNVILVQDQIKSMGYSAYSMGDSLEEVKKTSKMLQLILGGIGAVSLFVSAIGIANTMVMSIYERTKEIGVMKVLRLLSTRYT